MKSFRRGKQRTTAGPTIVATSIAPLSVIAALPALVRHEIGDEADEMCLVNIESSDGEYTIVLDAEWVALAREVNAQPGDLVAGLPLPGAAIHAVINGWAVTETFPDAVVMWSTDRTPYVGFDGTEAASG